MANAYKNKVVYGGNTLIDLTDATATASDVLSGKTAYGATGEKLTGTIASKSSSDLTASGATVTVPAGYYSAQASKSVSTTTHPTPTASVNSGTGLVTASHTQTAGYVTAGTTTGTLQLTTQAAKTVTPGTTSQTAVAAGRYTTGAVTVAGDENLVAENIVDGVTIFGVTGTASAGPAASTTLEENSWTVISAISKAGTGNLYWDVGDKKSIVLSGKIGALSLSNYTTYVFILDFNHPVNKTTADNNIIWGGFKTSDNVDIGLIDEHYNYSPPKVISFSPNHWTSDSYGKNYGGWKGCDLRYDILGGTSIPTSGYGAEPTTSRVGYDATSSTISSPVSNTLMAALPADFRRVLRLWTRYIDSVGNSSNSDANITATVDAITLLTEFEVYGTRKYANTYEKNHQKQMAYYSSGNTRVRYKHDATSTPIYWYMASPYSPDAIRFCMALDTGVSDYNPAARSLALYPAFKT